MVLGTTALSHSPLCPRYVAMRETGQILNNVRVADCADGPHEVRGCVRNDLVRTLTDALPQGTVRLGCSVASADFSPEGMPIIAQLSFPSALGLAYNQPSLSCHFVVRWVSVRRSLPSHGAS